MGTYGFPDIQGFYDQLYGTAGVDLQSLTLLQFGGASGIVFPGNPPFSINDFLSIYPNFFGPVLISLGNLTINSNVVNGLANVTGLVPGQLITGVGIPNATIIVGIGTNSITLNNEATLAATQTSLTIYPTPFVPLIVVNTYILLASYSVMHSRYHGMWFIMMCYFVAHYVTLYLRSTSGTPNLTASQVAASGLTKGVTIQRMAGDVSATQKLVLTGYDQWGAWQETQFGELFITVARATNMGPIWVP